jgi:hypothetical protein
MNEIEKKKTIFQIISHLKDVYKQLFLIFEWTKILNEHLALKYIKFQEASCNDKLHEISPRLLHNSAILSSNRHVSANFNLYQDLILSADRTPKYFVPSIASLSTSNDILNVELEDVWIPSVDSLLNFELFKNFIGTTIPKNDFIIKIVSNLACI